MHGLNWSKNCMLQKMQNIFKNLVIIVLLSQINPKFNKDKFQMGYKMTDVHFANKCVDTGQFYFKCVSYSLLYLVMKVLLLQPRPFLPNFVNSYLQSYLSPVMF